MIPMSHKEQPVPRWLRCRTFAQVCFPTVSHISHWWHWEEHLARISPVYLKNLHSFAHPGLSNEEVHRTKQAYVAW